MDIQQVVADLKQNEHGFKHIMLAGDKIYARSEVDHYEIALSLLDEESYQGRMLGTYLLGLLAPGDTRAFILLRKVVVGDENWRVQEMLAKAFDYYCARVGYAKALMEIESWMADPDPKLNRAVIEGLRIWTNRSYFREHPESAVVLISRHRGNESEYLRKSVGNALRDISKRFPDLVEGEIKNWDLANPKIAFTAKLARLRLGN